MSNPLFLDFETRSTVDLRKCGAEVYARHPSTEVMCVGVVDDSSTHPHVSLPKEVNWLVLDHVGKGLPVVAHNAPFELAIWNFCGVRRYGWPPLRPEQMVCTMAMAYSMALPGSLADAANAVNLGEQKDTVGNRIMMQLSQPRSGPAVDCFECAGSGVVHEGNCWCVIWYTRESHPEKFEKLDSYCKQDVVVERELYKRLMKLSQSEREVWLLDRKINDRGIEIDVTAVRRALEIVEIERERLNEEIQRLTQGAVGTFTAVGQLLDWIQLRGFPATGVAKSDVTALLELPALPSDVRQVLLIRQEAAKSSTAKLEAMLKGVCDDGRIRGLFQYHGAGATGRFAGRRIQPQNFPRPKLRQAQIDEVFELLRGA